MTILARLVLSSLLAVAVGGCDGKASASSEGEAPSISLALLWEKGDSEVRPDQDFGRIVDAALDEELNAYVLDASTNNIRVFDRNGRSLPTLSRSGRGPGELTEPVSLVHGGKGMLYVLDRVNGLVAIPTSNSNTAKGTSAPLPFIGSDFCLSRERVIVFGSHNGHPLHEVTFSGTIVKSFGDFDGPMEYPQHVPALNSNGKVACFPELDVVLTVPKLFPVVRAYRLADGAPLWADSVRGVVPWGVVVNPQFYSTGQHRDGSDETIVLRPLGSEQAVLQYRRSHQIDSAVATCVITIRTGGCLAVRDSTPRLVAARDGLVLSFTHGDYHKVALYRRSSANRTVEP